MSDYSHMIGKPYRPSNGTEGDCFLSNYCAHCLYDHPHPEKEPKCDILTASMCFGKDEPGYPQEWVWAMSDRFDGVYPTCTKYVHWDWGTDDEPNEPPPPPEPENPNQLCMPFIIDEIEQSRTCEKCTELLTGQEIKAWIESQEKRPLCDECWEFDVSVPEVNIQ